MNARTSSHRETRAESDRIRAARGFASFKVWQTANRNAARSMRKAGKTALADALDREFDRYISGNV